MRLAEHATQVLFECYFDKGSLLKSRAVYSDSSRVIYASTCEALSYLLRCAREHPDGALFLGQHWVKIAQVCDLVRTTWHSPQAQDATSGFPNDLDAPTTLTSLPTAFSTAAAIRFVYEAERVLDRYLDHQTKIFLDIPSEAPRGLPVGVRYPGNLGMVVDKYIKDKVDSTDPRERKAAFYSMIFFGPPGTAKTTLAKKIAKDLGWSFLVFHT